MDPSIRSLISKLTLTLAKYCLTLREDRESYIDNGNFLAIVYI